MVKKAFGEDSAKQSVAEKEAGSNLETDVYGDTNTSNNHTSAKPATKERAQTANKTGGKPPLASNGFHNLGSAREKANDDSLTNDFSN